MLNYYLFIAFSYSIAFAAILGLVRFKRIASEYRPFVYLCVIALLNEGVSTVCVEIFRSNVINANIYILIELYFLLWLFRNWGTIQRSNRFYLYFGVVLTAIWIFDNFLIHPFEQFNSIYRISYAIALVFLSIDHINFMIVTENRNILRNASFLIATGILLFYCLKGVIEVFYLFQIQLSDSFYNALIVMLAIVNLVSNLIYAIAILWIPQKQRFSLPY